MAKQDINLGTPNGKDGDLIRDAFNKVNQNFTELYTSIDSTVTVPTTSVGNNGDLQGDLAFDDTYIYYCTANYDGSTNIWKRVAWSTDIW
jgi:hypothetical protein